MRRKLSMLLGLLLVCALTVGLAKGIGVTAASKVKLNATKKTMYLGETFQLELSEAKGTVKWSTSSKKKATVANGLVTALKTGKVTIKAKDSSSGKTYKCKITIKKNAISNKKLSLKAGESYGLTLKGNTSAEWKSSNEKVARVNNGTVTALKKGTATITAKVGSNKYTCKVTVSGDDTSLTEPVELTMWCLSSGEGDMPEAYEQAIAELKEAYPNVSVKCEVFDNDYYKEKIKLAMAADELPDIYYTWAGAFLGDFVEAGKAYCLDDVLTKYVASGDIPKAMLGNTTYSGKSYGVPLYMNVVTLFANTELLKQAGYNEVPKTIEELLDCCDKLLEKGITPFGCSAQSWCISEYLETMVEKYIGADALNDIFAGKATFDNEFIAESWDLLRTMILKGYFGMDGLTDYESDITSNFINGDYAFYMNGSWNCGWIASSEYGDKIVAAEFPVIDSDIAGMGQLIGGPSDTLAVSASSKNTEVAAEYAVALGKLISKYGYLNGSGLPAWKISFDDSGVNELTKQVAKMCANAEAFVLFGDTALSADGAEIYLGFISQILSPDMDGKAFTEGLAKEIG